MVKCSVLNCKNYSVSKKRNCIKKELRYFAFPNETKLKNLWIQACGVDVKVKAPRICSEHFEENAFLLKDILLNAPLSKRRLKKNAVPTKNLSIKIDENKEKKINNKNKQLAYDGEESCKRNMTEISEMEDEEENYFLSENTKLAEEILHKQCGKILLFNKTFKSLTCELLFECTFCKKTFDRISNFVRHLNEEHFQEYINSKDINDINFSDNKIIFEPNNEISENIDFINKNKNLIDNNDNKLINTENIKLQKSLLSCKICSKKFKFEKFHKIHEESCHTIKLYESKVIDFDQKNLLDSSEQDYKFENDDNDDDDDYNRNLHITVQSIKNPLICRYCNKKFNTRIKCIEHECMHNGIKLYTCEYCKHEFSRKYNFKVHLNMHMDIKPNKCRFCQKSFVRKEHLNIHLRRHLNDRKYKCNYCEKSFIVMGDKKLHEQTHTGKLPYLCSQCGKFFPSKFKLFIHFKLKHS